MNLNPQEKSELLQIARKTLETYLGEAKFIERRPSSPALQEKAGVFVTLQKRGELRGCIGHMTADRPLFRVTQEMAVQAAAGDPRFSSVTLEELPEIEIEISVLSPFQPISHPDEIRIGEHGLTVSQGHHRGVLLPQVPVRENWNREEFLGATCLKAGLPRDGWKSGDVRIEVFTAEVFGEQESRT